MSSSLPLRQSTTPPEKRSKSHSTVLSKVGILFNFLFFIQIFGILGKKLSMTMKVDPSILGGMLVDFDGEHYIDMSIRSKFNFYQNLIKQAV